MEHLKQKLTSEPIINHHPDWSKPFILDTDAGPMGISAVLSQMIDGRERVVMYASRKQSDVETRYHQYEKEALALVWGVELMRPYLYGRKFLARTDNQALKYLYTRSQNSRVMRWVMRLQEFSFDIQHRHRGQTRREKAEAAPQASCQAHRQQAHFSRA